MHRALFLFFLLVLPILSPGRAREKDFTSNSRCAYCHSLISSPLTRNVPDELKPSFEVTFTSPERRRDEIEKSLQQRGIQKSDEIPGMGESRKTCLSLPDIYLHIRVLRI